MSDVFGAVAPLPLYPPPGPNYVARQLWTISDFIVHHSAGPVDQTPFDIDAEHRAEGMAFIAYNWIIDSKGTILQGRPIGWVSSASHGRNSTSVAVCLIGNFQSDDSGYTGVPTTAQLDSLNQLALRVHINLPSIDRTIAHRDIETIWYPGQASEYGTACSGDELYKYLPDVRVFVKRKLYAKL